MKSLILVWLVVVGVVACTSGIGLAAGPRVLPEGQLPDDVRLGPLKNLNDYFPFDPPETREAWEARARKLRRQLLVALGLWPLPEAAPLAPVIHGRVDRCDYTVEKVFFESYPGHFVTGSLYRPKGKSGKLPGVLCPHGHWANGRFFAHGEKELAQELASGGEKYERGGRYPLQARCVQLARMGCVVFHYDMLGYADSVQIEHRTGVRKGMNTPEGWGFFSPQAELRLQTNMGLQTYNSMRALDFLTSLADVDAERIGVTGASGGGTQTFILCAIDPRPKVAFPAVMVSTGMQGGCTCENCSYLRVGTGNVEIAALFAPKPLGMSAANDWTKEIETKGYPELRRLFGLYDAQDRVMVAAFLQFGHNYNYVSRAAMYSWMNRHLELGLDEPVAENDYEPLTIAEMTVWDEEHPRPPRGPDYERSLLRTITADSEKQLAAVAPRDAKSLEKFREVVGGAWETILGTAAVQKAEPGEKLQNSRQINSVILEVGMARFPDRGAGLPTVALYDAEKFNAATHKRAVLWVTPSGKMGLFDDHGQPLQEVQELLDEGCIVVGADLLYQGEFLQDGKPLEKQPMVQDALVGYAGYTYGYNYPLFSQRVQDIVALAATLDDFNVIEEITLVGLGGTGPLVAAAVAMAGDHVDRAVIETMGFRFAELTKFDHPDFLPGAVKYGDVPALLALCAGKRLFVAGEGSEMPPLLKQAAESAGAADEITMHGDPATSGSAAVDWILRD